MIHSHVKNENKATASQFYLAQDVIPGVFAEKWAKISSFQPGGFPHSTFFKAAPLGLTLNPSGNTFVFPMTHTSFLKLMPIVSSSVNQQLLFRVTGWSSQVLPMRSKEMFVPTILGEYKFTPNSGFLITSPFGYSDPHANAKAVKDLTTQGILTTNQKLSGNVDPNYITLKGQGAEYIQIQMMLQEPATATGSCCNLVTNTCRDSELAANCLAMNQEIWFQGTTCNGYSCIWNGCPEREPPCECTDTTTTCCPNECPDTSICNPPRLCFPCLDNTNNIVCNTFNGICPPGTTICNVSPCPSCNPDLPTCTVLNLVPPSCDLGSCCCDFLGECYDINRGQCAILSGINSCFEFNESTPCPSPTTCPSGIDEFGSCCDTIANTCVESFRADCLAPKIFSLNQSCFGDCTYRQVSTSDGNNTNGEKNFSAVVTKFGKVRVFGNNTYPAVYAIPTDLEVIQNVQVGKSFVCALELISGTPPTSGTIKVWGQPDSTGVLTVPSNLGPCSAISAGSSHIAVIKGVFGSSGFVQAWGNPLATSVPSDLGKCIAIDSSGAYTAAVQAVVPAGQESLNGLRLWGVVPPAVATIPDFTGYHGSNISIIDVSISSSNAAVLFNDGSFRVWGNNTFGQLNVPSNIGTIKQISCGKNHIIVIKSNGDVVSWGLNACLQTSMPSDLGKCVSVSAGDGYSCAVKLNGLLECWSCNQGSLDFTCNDANAAPNESPCHWTSLTNASTGFYVSTTPITNKQFSGLSTSNPDQPKVNETWNVYNNWANNQSLRLLTEAEWELAAKGGVSGPIYGVLNNIAWHLGNSSSTNKNVAGKQPNAYGLYDTIGLVKEFVFDFIYPYVASSFDNPIVNPIGQITDGLTNHIIRGGSFLSPIVECRSTWRGSVHTSNTGVDIGFRVARTATASTTWITQVMQDQATALDIPDPVLRNLINNSGHSWWVRKSIGPGLFIDLKFIPNVVFNQGASSVTDSCGGNCPDINITTLPDCESLCSIIVPGKCCTGVNSCTQTDQEECAALGGVFTPGAQCAAGNLCNNIWGRCCNQNICQNDVLSINCTGTNNVFTPYLINQPGSAPRCIQDCPGQLRCVSETGKCCNPLNNDCLNTKKCNCLAPMVFTPSAECYQLSPGNPLRCVQVIGACCNNLTNACVQNEDWQCAALGSNHSFTPGGSCSGSFCSGLIGACCNIAMGQCINNLTSAQCSAQPVTSGSWVWHAAPKVCFSPTQCPERRGRCCSTPFGNCFNTNQFECATLPTGAPGNDSWTFVPDEFCRFPTPLNPQCSISLFGSPCCCSALSGCNQCVGRCCRKTTNECFDGLCSCDSLGDAQDYNYYPGESCEICSTNCNCQGLPAGFKVCNHPRCKLTPGCNADPFACPLAPDSFCLPGYYCDGGFGLGVATGCTWPCDFCPIPTSGPNPCVPECGFCRSFIEETYSTCSQFVSVSLDIDNGLNPIPNIPSDFKYQFTGNGNPHPQGEFGQVKTGSYGAGTVPDICPPSNPQCPGYPQKSLGADPYIRWNRYNSGVNPDTTVNPSFAEGNLNSQVKEEFDMFIACGCIDSQGRSSTNLTGWSVKNKPWICDARHQVKTIGFFEPFASPPIIPPSSVLLSNNRNILPAYIVPRDITDTNDLESPLMRKYNNGSSWGANPRRLRACDSRSFWNNPQNKNWQILGCADATCTSLATDNVQPSTPLVGYLSIFGNNWTDNAMGLNPREFSPRFQYKNFSFVANQTACITCKFGVPDSVVPKWNLLRNFDTTGAQTGNSNPFISFGSTIAYCPTTTSLLDSTGTTNEFTVFIQSFSS